MPTNIDRFNDFSVYFDRIYSIEKGAISTYLSRAIAVSDIYNDEIF